MSISIGAEQCLNITWVKSLSARVFTRLLYVWNKGDCKKLLEWVESEARPSDPAFYIIQRWYAFILASVLHLVSLQCSVVRHVILFTFSTWRLWRDYLLSPRFSYVCCDVQRSRDIVQIFLVINLKKGLPLNGLVAEKWWFFSLCLVLAFFFFGFSFAKYWNVYAVC